MRANGGVRDRLIPKNIAVLSGDYDSRPISMLGLPACGKGDFVVHLIDGREEEEIAAEFDLFNPKRKRQREKAHREKSR